MGWKFRGTSVLVVLTLAACGGKSDRQEAGDGGDGATGSHSMDDSSTGDGSTGDGSSRDGSSGDGEASSGGPGGASSGGASTATGTEQPFEPIDEIEEQDPALVGSPAGFFWGPGYFGNWFVSTPEPSSISGDAESAEIAPPRGESTKAYRVQGSGYERGVDLWAQLLHPQGSAVDLSEYAGIAFWAKLDGSNDRLVVAANPGGGYFDAPHEIPSVEVSASSEWQQFVLPFQAFDIGSVVSVVSFDFIVGEDGGDFDLWVDDLMLLCDGECPSN